MTDYVLSESLAHLLNKTGVKMGDVFLNELQKHDLNIGMWRIMAAIWSNGESRLGDLEQLTGMDLSTLSRQVTALVKRGLVTRTKSKIDSRALNIGLSPDGHGLVQRLIPTVELYEAAALDGVSAAESRRLKQLLLKIFANLQVLEQSSSNL